MEKINLPNNETNQETIKQALTKSIEEREQITMRCSEISNQLDKDDLTEVNKTKLIKELQILIQKEHENFKTIKQLLTLMDIAEN